MGTAKQVEIGAWQITYLSLSVVSHALLARIDGLRYKWRGTRGAKLTRGHASVGGIYLLPLSELTLLIIFIKSTMLS